jgi:hypothetical protein
MTAHHRISPHMGSKLYLAVNMYLHMNRCRIRTHAQENKTQHTVCVLRILITKYKILSFSNHNLEDTQFVIKIRGSTETLGSTSVANTV